MRKTRWRLAAFSVVALIVFLQIQAIERQSLSGDGAHHLIAAHQALRFGQNTLNLEHPPLVKLIIGLPLLIEERAITPSTNLEEIQPAVDSLYGQGELLDRVVRRARGWLLILVVIPLFAACFWLGLRAGGEAGGKKAGFLLAAIFGLSFNVLPYLTTLQTDAAISLALLLILLACAALIERPSLARSAWLGLAVGLALASKFSAVFFLPTVAYALLRAETSWRRRFGLGLLIGAVALVALHLPFWPMNLDHREELGASVIKSYARGHGTLIVGQHLEPFEETLLAINKVDSYLAQWLTGLLGVRAQNAEAPYLSYAFGDLSSKGRWWFYPVVFLVKTPLILLLLLPWTILQARRDGHWRQPWPGLVGLTLTIYLAMAMTSNYNLSMRHLLPMIPLILLPVALVLARRPAWAAGLIALLACEAIVLAPLWMSATNTWWLGAQNPTRFSLSAANLDYRQNFKELAIQSKRRGIEPLTVLYPLIEPPVLHRHLPDARLFRPGQPLGEGWFAVNLMIEQLAPTLLDPRIADKIHSYDWNARRAREWQPVLQSLHEHGEDHGIIAGSFRLIYLERPPP